METLAAHNDSAGGTGAHIFSYTILAGKADERLLKSITSNPSHVLRKYLPKLKNTGHNLRPRAHGYELPPKDDLNFIPRTLYNALLRK